MSPTELLALRTALGLSQAGLAELIGVTPNTVARWERGEMGMRATTSRLLKLVTEGKVRRKRKAGK